MKPDQDALGLSLKKYEPLLTFAVIADNFHHGIKSQTFFLYKGQVFNVWGKQKDLVDPDCEHWGTDDGWLLKIQKRHLANLVEAN